jgi:hypothetical protein
MLYFRKVEFARPIPSPSPRNSHYIFMKLKVVPSLHVPSTHNYSLNHQGISERHLQSSGHAFRPRSYLGEKKRRLIKSHPSAVAA